MRTKAVLLIILMSAVFFFGISSLAQTDNKATSVIVSSESTPTTKNPQTPVNTNNDNEAIEALDSPIVPDDYILAPGDYLELQLWGKLTDNYAVKIPADGEFFLPDLGTFKAAGKSLLNFRNEVSGRVNDTFKNVHSALIIKQIHPVKIQIIGQVVKPGWYTFRGLVRVSEAVQKAGGVLDNGSYKNITMTRSADGKMLSINLRSIQLQEPGAPDPYVTSGDIINCRLQENLVEVVGQFFAPKVYEIAPGDRLSDIIFEAGGPTLFADMNNTYVERGYEKIEFDIKEVIFKRNKSQNIELQPGDKIFCGKTPDVVYILGGVKEPGPQKYDRNFTIGDYIGFAKGPTGNARLGSTTIVRGLPDNVNKTLVDLRHILKGDDFAETPKIQPGDVIIIPTEDKMSITGYLSMLLSIITISKIND